LIALLVALVTWLCVHSAYTGYDRLGNGIYGLRDIETVVAIVVGLISFLLISGVGSLWSSVRHRGSRRD
jgi:hypothetical protein